MQNDCGHRCVHNLTTVIGIQLLLKSRKLVSQLIAVQSIPKLWRKHLLWRIGIMVKGFINTQRCHILLKCRNPIWQKNVLETDNLVSIKVTISINNIGCVAWTIIHQPLHIRRRCMPNNPLDIQFWRIISRHHVSRKSAVAALGISTQKDRRSRTSQDVV